MKSMKEHLNLEWLHVRPSIALTLASPSMVFLKLNVNNQQSFSQWLMSGFNVQEQEQSCQDGYALNELHSRLLKS